MSFWDQRPQNRPPVVQQTASETYQDPVEFDEAALEEIQQEQYDVFEEEDDDISSVLANANKRLECGRLFEMLIKSNIFGETDADPEAIKTVERLMRNFAKTQLEIMLGMRQEQPTAEAVIVSSPFNDMEVTVLKMLASKMSKGATEQQEDPALQAPQAPVAPPKKDGISAINGSVKAKAPQPLRREVKPIQRAPQKPQQPAPKKAVAPKPTEESALTKPIDQMTPAELAAYDKAASEKHSRKYAAMPNNLVPMPSTDQLVQMYTVQGGSPGASTVAKIQAQMNNKTQ